MLIIIFLKTLSSKHLLKKDETKGVKGIISLKTLNITKHYVSQFPSKQNTTQYGLDMIILFLSYILYTYRKTYNRKKLSMK